MATKPSRLRTWGPALQSTAGTPHTSKSTRAGFPLGSLVGPGSCAGLVLMQPVLAGQRRPQEPAKGINLATGFQRLKSFEVDLPMRKCATSSLHDYLLLQHLPEQ